MKKETIDILERWKGGDFQQKAVAEYILKECEDEIMETRFLEKFGDGDFSKFIGIVAENFRKRAVNGVAMVEDKEVFGIISHVIRDAEIQKEEKVKPARAKREEIKNPIEEIKKNDQPLEIPSKPKKRKENPDYEQIDLFGFDFNS